MALALILLLLYVVVFVLNYPRSFLAFDPTTSKCNGLTSSALFLVAVLVLWAFILLIRVSTYFSVSPSFLFLDVIVSTTVMALILPLLRYFTVDPQVSVYFGSAIYLLLLTILFTIRPSLVSILNVNTLNHFCFVSVPDPAFTVDLEIDHQLKSATTTNLIVLAGQPGCGKSVSLYRFLQNEHVVWLNARNTLCQNLANYGINVNKLTEQDCFQHFQTALTARNHRFSLVIDDVQVVEPDSLYLNLFKGYGSGPFLPFPIFFTVSDMQPYRNTIEPLIYRVENLRFFHYPPDDKILQLTNKLGPDFNKTMLDVGPSLRLIQMYAQDPSLISNQCDDYVGNIQELKTHDHFLFSFVRDLVNQSSISSDRHGFQFSMFDLTAVEPLCSKNLLIKGLKEFYWHNPLVLRAACTSFGDEVNLSTGCKFVSKCFEIEPLLKI
ncbi:hypothetical protein RCL1_002765 [Eukaryota sp. TZLM3-RCL]